MPEITLDQARLLRFPSDPTAHGGVAFTAPIVGTQYVGNYTGTGTAADARVNYGGGKIAYADGVLWALAHEYTVNGSRIILTAFDPDTLLPTRIARLPAAPSVVYGGLTYTLLINAQSRFAIVDDVLYVPMVPGYWVLGTTYANEGSPTYVAVFDLATQAFVRCWPVPGGGEIDVNVLGTVPGVTYGLTVDGERVYLPIFERQVTRHPGTTNYTVTNRYLYAVWTLEGEVVSLPSGYPAGQRYGTTEYRLLHTESTTYKGFPSFTGARASDIAVRTVAGVATVLATFSVPSDYGVIETSPGYLANASQGRAVLYRATESAAAFSSAPLPIDVRPGSDVAIIGGLPSVAIIGDRGLVAMEEMRYTTGQTFGFNDVLPFPTGVGVEFALDDGEVLAIYDEFPGAGNPYLIRRNGPIDLAIGDTVDGVTAVYVATSWPDLPFLVYPELKGDERLSTVLDRKLGILHAAYQSTGNAIYYTSRGMGQTEYGTPVLVVSQGAEPAISLEPAGGLRIDYRTQSAEDGVKRSSDLGRTWN